MRPASAFQAPPSGQVQTAAATPADAALVERLIAATDAERIALVQAHPEILGLPFRQAVGQLGQSQRIGGHLAEAERTYGTLLFLGKQFASPPNEISGLLGLAAVEGTRSNLTQAQTYLEGAMRLSIATKNLAGQQQALSNLAILQRRRGDLDGALATQLESLAMARAADDKLAIGRLLNNIGNTYRDMGNAARALEYYLQSLALKETSGAPITETTTTLNNIGGVYDEQSDYALAIDYYRRAIDLVGGDGPIDSITSAYGNMGHAYAAIGEFGVARSYLNRALAFAEKVNDPGRIATVTYNLGTVARAEGALDESEALQRKALALRESTGDRLGVIESMTEIGNLLTKRGRTVEAVPFGERAVAMASESRLLNQLWKAQITLGRTFENLKQTAEARRYYEGAIDTIETLRQLTAGGARAQQQYLSERMGPYYSLAGLDAEAGRSFNALSVVDHARARTLTDIMAGGRPTTQRLTDTQRNGERRVTEAVMSASSLLDTEVRKPRPNPERVVELEAGLTKARLAREAYISALYSERPDLRLARGNTPEITPERVASVLPAGTAIVTFVLDDRQAWTYVVTNSPTGPVVTTHALAMATLDITRLAEQFATQVSTRDLAFAPNARKLYDVLFGKADAALAGMKHVIVIPDGPLWQVPFQALQTSRGTFLVEEHAISYTPSITALAALEERRRSRATSSPFLIALGDPDTGLATTAGPATTALQRGRNTARLPEAAREVRALGKLYGAAKSAVFVAADAKESVLRAKVGRASVLHVATHGVLDDHNPMYSHLLLAPGDPAGKIDANDHLSDGRLEAWEVLDMGITADLAVLSACETARGGSGWGEGTIGLSWSLFASGVSTTVVSQWEVDSTSTTALMIAFHQRLLGASTRASGAPEALRQAALTLLKNPAYRHPFYWAGFISVGAK
jgi:CHAT domain-containing protein/Tfp pilus assembly protein PilF